MVVFDGKGRFVRSWGKTVSWRGARAPHPQGSRHRVPVPHGQRDQPAVDSTAGDAGGRRQDNPGRGDRLENPGSARQSTEYKPSADGKPAPYNPTNIAIAPNGDIYVGDGYGSYYVNQYTSKGEYIRTFGGKGSEPGRLAEPHGIWVDTRAAAPVLVVADRRNNRLQRFTLDGTHIDFVPGFRLPCHFDEQNGTVVIPDLHGRVTLDRSQQPDHRTSRRLERAGVEQSAADAAARQVHPRPVHLPARRLLRPRRQHLRRRMGRGRAGHQAAESRLRSQHRCDGSPWSASRFS